MARIVRHVDPADPQIPIEHIATKKGEDEAFETFVQELVGQIQAARQKFKEFLEPEWAQCELNYYAINDRENWGSRDSNLDFTITFEICQDSSSNLYNPVFSQDTVFMAKGRPGFKQMAAETDDMLDWMADQGNYASVCDTTIRHAQIYSKTIVKCGWQYKEETVRFWDGKDAMGMLQEAEEKRQSGAGCVPHVVDPRRFLHPFPLPNIEEAPWVAEEFDSTIAAVKAEKESGYYRQDLDVHSIGKDAPSEEKKSEAGAAFGTDGNLDKDAEEKDSPRKIQLLECYTQYKGREAIIYLDESSETWVAAIYNYFQSRPRPYVTFSWYEVLNSVDGRSLCQTLDPLHRAYAGIMNILMDGGVRSVEPLIIALESLGLSRHLDNGRIGPGLHEADAPILEDLKKGIATVELTNGDLRFLIDLLGRIEKHMRDAASIPAMFRGEEVAERPTATGTSAIMDKAMQPLYKQMTRYRLFLAEIAKMQYARFRQFFPERLEIYLSSKGESGEMLRQMMTFPEGYWEDQVLIEVKVNANTMSKSVKKQEALAMVDKLPEIFQQLIPLLQMIAGGGPEAPAAQVMLDTQMLALRAFFTEFEMPEVRDALQMESANMLGQAIAQAQQQLIGIIEALRQDLTAANSKLIEAGQEPIVPSIEGGNGGGGSGPAQAAA